MTDEAATPAVHPLIDEVYGELRRLAGGYLRRERANSLQATELVHDAYLRLANAPHGTWQNRTHFLAIAAISMRRLLIERARARHADKRGGDQVRVTLDTHLHAAAQEPTPIDILALDEALDTLARLDPRQARIVELRFFGGLTVEETADVLDISPVTVKRDWAVARAWLLRTLSAETPA